MHERVIVVVQFVYLFVYRRSRRSLPYNSRNRHECE